MSNYTDRVNLKSTIYYLSADFANSANTSTIASSYTFDKPIEIWDDFMQITLDHPYQYGSEQVTAIRASAVNLQTSAQDHTFTTNVYDAGYNAITQASVNAHVLSSYDFYRSNNSHFVESINGELTQTAHVTEQITNQQWVIPVKFKIASCYNAKRYLDLESPEYMSDPNVWGINRQTGREESHHIYAHAGEDAWRLTEYLIWGTTFPAVLFKEAGIYNIPVYKEDNPTYRLNVQIFDTLGNVGHVADVQSNQFVQFMQNLQNVSNCEIVSGSVKATQYTESDRIVSAHSIAYIIDVRPYTLLSANVDDTRKSVGSILYPDRVNALRYAFYDAQGNYQSLDVTNNKIYDEYTYYCVMPTSAYTTTAAATAAIQSVIDSCNYAEAQTLDFESYGRGRGTIPSSTLVFDSFDSILTTAYNNERTVFGESHKWDIIPQGIYIDGVPFTVTAVLTTSWNLYKEIDTVITKPEILTADIKQISTTSYSYAFDSLYVVNSAFNYFNSSSNKTVYKDAVFNMILYSAPEVAPVEQCRATYAGYDVLCCNYYNVCNSAFKHDKLPASTDRMIRNESLIPVALASTTYTTASFAEPPTRDIYFTITMSK